MSEPFVQMPLSGWGRMSPAPCHVFRPEKVRALRSILEGDGQSSYLARGLGRSYGDAAVNAGAGVIDMTRLDRMLAFDPATGALHCEAGVSLAEIIAVFLPRGFFLPVTPGTKFVTVGGAIANDIHGKNHHRDGTFGQFVDEIELLTAAGDVMVCSPHANAEVFWATVGGIGLTGIILSARIRLQPVETGYVCVDYRRARDLDEALAAMAESDARYKYSVCWVDCLAAGGSLGRSVLMPGNPARRDQLQGAAAARPLEVPAGRKRSVPFDFPGFVLNPLSIRAFNTLFYGMHRDAPGQIVDFDRYFYPLDRIHAWNRLYGKRGFAQYQATLPKDQAAGVKRLLERLSAAQRASFLAVLKCFGPANQGLLSHPVEGYTLTLDLPNHGDLRGFLGELDQIVLDHGGRLYTAKDGAASAFAFSQMYPKLEAFRAMCARLDPKGRFASSMARRLGIREA